MDKTPLFIGISAHREQLIHRKYRKIAKNAIAKKKEGGKHGGGRLSVMTTKVPGMAVGFFVVCCLFFKKKYIFAAMYPQQRQRQRVATISLDPYLVAYARAKFHTDKATGGIVVPDSFDLYHLLWHLMQKPNGRTMPPVDDIASRLKIFLPCRRSGSDDVPRKRPEYWNYLSPDAAAEIGRAIRQLFNFDLHTRLMDNETQGRPLCQYQVCEQFIRDYRLGDTVEVGTLLKNFQRYRQAIAPRKPRKYQKRKPFKRNFKII